jgi:peptidyl-prolyl cis-trans isomerase C
MKTIVKRLVFLGWQLYLLALLAGCRTTPPTLTPTEPVASTATPTPAMAVPTIQPTPSHTPIPLAAVVNGEGITLEEFQAELARYQNALNSGTNLATDLSSEASQLVLNDLISLVLLAQEASAQGFVQDEAAIQARWDQLANQVGGAQALEGWMTNNGYTTESFRKALTRSLAATWMRDQILAAAPATAEQTHARQILLYNSTQANEAFAQLQSGYDFITLAKKYDPVTGGELGWFPRGYLTENALEEAAFSLAPGQYSPVIQTPLGYHILFVIERDPSRLLEPNARLILQEKALSDWLQQRRAQSEIQIILP